MVLRPALEAGDVIHLKMDGTRGYASSFLEEAFGGLIRAGYSKEKVLSGIKFETTDEALVIEITEYINQARG